MVGSADAGGEGPGMRARGVRGAGSGGTGGVEVRVCKYGGRGGQGVGHLGDGGADQEDKGRRWCRPGPSTASSRHGTGHLHAGKWSCSRDGR